MNALQDQITEIGELLAGLQSSSENKEAIEEYTLLITRLTPVCNELKLQCDTRKIIGHLPDDFMLQGLKDDEFEQYATTQSFIDIFRNSWEEVEHKARQDNNSLDNSVQSIRVLNKDLSQANRQAWDTWISELIISFEISDVELDSQEDVPGLRENIRLYKDKAHEFQMLTDTIPNDTAALEEILTIAKCLESLRGNMDFNLPKGVKTFFKQLNNSISGNQFPLSSLTPEVIKWLTENDQLTNFVIKRKGMYR